MIPPALFEVIKHIPQWVFNVLEADGCEHEQFEITDDDSLREPAQKMAKGKDI